MKCFAPFLLLIAVLIAAVAFSASLSVCQISAPPDPYKPTLDRLQALTSQGEAEWRFHADVPHPEDPTIDDSSWSKITVKNVSGPGGRNENEEHWTGTSDFRRWIQRRQPWRLDDPRVLQWCNPLPGQ
jgi:hypothetical protein